MPGAGAGGAGAGGAGASRLPAFVPPMLARPGREPFDSDQHLFEFKWDGFRAVALVEGGRYRLWSRNRADFVPKYPELGVLASLPPGTALDGELVRLRDGKPDFGAMLGGAGPVTYLVFDLLYRDFSSWMGRPLSERREALARVVADAAAPRLVLSEGVVGEGRSVFAQVLRLGFEGMVAKRLDGRYEPGRRSGSWTKVKAGRTLLAVVLGWIPDEAGDVKSLLVGAPGADGTLRFVGRVGSGLAASERARWRELLAARATDAPVVPCGREPGRWVVPDLFCEVRYLEFTRGGTLRAPVFVRLVEEPRRG